MKVRLSLHQVVVHTSGTNIAFCTITERTVMFSTHTHQLPSWNATLVHPAKKYVERGTVRVKCLGQEHNTMSLARA